jgi:hypothetical protein
MKIVLKTFATNIIITNFKYPSAAKDLNRIVITANHKKEDWIKIIRFWTTANSKFKIMHKYFKTYLVKKLEYDDK